jgi:hypothetical protein
MDRPIGLGTTLVAGPGLLEDSCSGLLVETDLSSSDSST